MPVARPDFATPPANSEASDPFGLTAAIRRAWHKQRVQRFADVGLANC